MATDFSETQDAADEGQDGTVHDMNGALLMALPTSRSFEGGDWRPAHELQGMAQELIGEHERFEFIKRVRIQWMWKAKGGMKSGSLQIADIIRTPSLARYHDGGSDFTAYFCVDNCDAVRLTQEQAYAQTYHLLRHLRYNSDTDKVLIQGHQFEGFADEVEQFGYWQESLKKAARAFQMRLSFEGAPPEDEVPQVEDEAAEVGE